MISCNGKFSADVEVEEHVDLVGELELFEGFDRLPKDSWPNLEFKELDLDSGPSTESQLFCLIRMASPALGS